MLAVGLRMLHVTRRPAPLCRAAVSASTMQVEPRQKVQPVAATSSCAPPAVPDTPAAQAYVRYKPSEDNITISLTVAGRQRNLNRPIDEPLIKPLGRLRANLAPEKGKKVRKRGKDTAEPGPPQEQVDDTVELYADAAATQPIDGTTPNLQAWTGAAVLRLGPCLYDLALNPPTVDALSLPGFPMADHPILPTTLLSFADAGACSWRWLRSAAAAAGSNDKGGGAWEDTGCTNMCYTPTAADVGHQLRVECTPGRWLSAPAAAGAGGDPAAMDEGEDEAGGEGDAAGVASGASLQRAHSAAEDAATGSPHTLTTLDLAKAAAAAAAAAAHGAGPAAATGAACLTGEPATADCGPVIAAPAVAAAGVRCPGGPLAPAAAPGFRIMSYNILADQYAGTSYAQQVLFKYCPTQLLDNNYRRQLVLQEVLRYQPDVVCLQEVDDKVFAEYLAPHLALAGYGGAYTNKQGRVREGSAMFWRRSRLQLAARHDVLLRDVFAPPLAPRHSQFQPLLDASPTLVEALQKVTTIGQLLLLVPTSPGHAAASAQQQQQQLPPLLVANTHLFFHPFAPHIRTIHTAAILEEAAAAVECWRQGQALQVHPPSAEQQRDAPAVAAGASPHQPQQQDTVSGPPTQQQQQQQQGVSWVSPHAQELLAAAAGPPCLLFCGDLNSDLNDGVPGVVALLGSGQLPADHWDWSYGKLFRWGKEEGEYTDAEAPTQDDPQQQQQQQQPSGQAPPQQPAGPTGTPLAGEEAPAVLGLDLQVPYALRSADDLKTPYTNYTSGYQALLDYVWYPPQRLRVTQQLAVPSPEQMTGYIPNAAFPSDHLAVVYDLEPGAAQQ